MALVAVPAGYSHHLEAGAGVVIGERERGAEPLDLVDGDLEQLCEQTRLDGLGGHHHDGLDGADQFAVAVHTHPS